MRVCMVVDRFHPLIGGVEQQTLQLSKALIDCNVQVMVLTRRVNQSLPAFEELEGVSVYRVPPGGRRSHWLNLISVPIFVYALLRHRRRFDVLHVHDMFALFLAAVIFHWLTRKPFIVKVPTHGNVERRASKTTHTSLYSWLLHRVILPDFFWRLLLKQPASYIAISQEIADELSASGLADKIVRIPNAVDVSRFRPLDHQERTALRARLGFDLNDFVIVSHGRIVARKRLDVLIDAVSRLASTHRGIRLVLPGPFYPPDPALKDSLNSMVQTSKLSDVIIFTGATDEPEMFLRAADCFVLPSEREGMPNALLEAMACKLPVIASEIGGVTDVLRHTENGFMFAIGDVNALVDLLNMCIRDADKTLALANEAHRTIQQDYIWSVISQKYKTLYANLV